MRLTGGSLAPVRHLKVLVATTWRCNLACTYCFVESIRELQGQEVMSPDTAIRVVDALDQSVQTEGGIEIHLYGGEALTNLSALAAMVERALEKRPGRFTFSMTTNGTVLSEEVIDLLRAGDFAITLSIDGPAEIHDSCRRTIHGTPTHALVSEFLRMVREQTNCWICGSAVVRPGWRLRDAHNHLRSLGVDAIKAQIVRGPPDSRFSLSKEERQRYLADLEVVAQQVIEELEAGAAPPIDNRFTCHVLQLVAGGRHSRSYCGSGRSVFGILPAGEVVPCVLIHPVEEVLGHVDDDPQVWLRAGEKWLRSRELRSECRTCEQYSLCGGGCPAILPVCGSGECEFVAKECSLATEIHDHFSDRPEALLGLIGIG